MELQHIPLTEFGTGGKLEYSHFRHAAVPNEWRRENRILQGHVKINLFFRGEFSLFAGNRIYRPSEGQICILTPYEPHSGQISGHTELEYYQFDVDSGALDALPGGRELMERLSNRKRYPEIVFPAGSEGLSKLLALCGAIERAVADGDRITAFCQCVCALSLIAALREQNQAFPAGKGPVSLSYYPTVIVRYLEEHYGNSVTLGELAKVCGVSTSWLERVFRKETGTTLHAYLIRCRVLKATEVLANRPVGETGNLCGFSDASHFIREFRRYMGMTPGEYRRLALRETPEKTEKDLGA